MRIRASLSKAKRQLKRLHKVSSAVLRLSLMSAPHALTIRRCLVQALVNRVGNDDRAWIERIETLRQNVTASEEPLSRTDYGAGTPGRMRSAVQMQTGVAVTDTVGGFASRASKSDYWCRLFFLVIRAMKPSSCIEMGSAVGISAAYQAAALTLNGKGSLTTIEGDPSLVELTKNNLQALGLHNVQVIVGRFVDRLGEVLEANRPVDYVFVDGHHDETATLTYFEQIVPFLADSAVLIFDDIAWSQGMKSAWQAIASDARVHIAIDLGQTGLCILGSSS